MLGGRNKVFRDMKYGRCTWRYIITNGGVASTTKLATTASMQPVDTRW